MTDLRFFEFYPNNLKKEWNRAHFFLRIMFGDGQVEAKGGGGIWEDVKRPYLPPLTVWRGPSESYTLKIPFVLDAYGENNNSQDRQDSFGHSVVDQQKWEIEKLAGVLVHLNKGTLPEPPTLILDGYGTIPHDETNEPNKHVWIIPEPPEWGEWIRDGSGLLLRQAGVLTFRKHESDISLERAAPPVQESTLHADGKQSYEEIALHQLRHSHWGTKLARLQHKPQPHQNAREVPRRGLIRGPSEKQLKEWLHK